MKRKKKLALDLEIKRLTKAILKGQYSAALDTKCKWEEDDCPGNNQY